LVRVHEVVGFVVVGVFTVGWLFGLVLWISKRAAGDWFWRWLVAAQVVAITQAVLGIVLLAMGRRPSTSLHYVYGFGPLVVIAIAHTLARDPAFEERPWAPFAIASFICFGLSLRALMTGLGIG
jgi:hypothetical protein